MIKNFTFLFVFFSLHLLKAQSVPNGGFESWQVNTYENPVNFQTSNYEQKNGFNTGLNAVKTTDAFSGQYAIKLTTQGTGTNSSFAFFANGNPGGPVFQEGIPYSQKPTGIRFHYKANIVGNDSAIFIVMFKKNGAMVGSYIYKFFVSKTNYTFFNPTFSPALTITPDTMMIACASSNAFLNSGYNAGNSIQIDSIALKGVVSQPALLNGNFENWTSLSNYKLNGWGLEGDFTRSTDFYSGSYALELQTQGPSFGNNNLSAGRAHTGTYSFSNTIQGGTPYSTQIDTLVFFYKYLPADPVDSARFFLNFKKNGVTLPAQTYKLLNISASYKQVVIPFNVGQAPDTMVMSFESSKWPTQSSYIGSDLKIDNLYLKSQRLPISNFMLPPVGCVGQPVQLNDASFNMANAWGWIMPGGSPGSSTSQNPVVIYNSIGTKTITMVCNNQFGASSTISKTITINQLPNVASTSTVTPCGGSTVVLTASGANNYTWSSGQTTPTISVAANATTIFTVEGVTNGCSNSAIGVVVVPGVPRPDICMVTVDSLNQYNNIYWDKSAYPMLDSMIIYREVIANTYKRIGAVSKTALSMFIDTARSVGPANGDPNISSYRYKLQIRDTCGSYGQKSLWHNTVYFTHSAGTFFWTNNYLIEGPINPVQTYSLLVCVNPSVSASYSLVGTTTGNQSTLNDPFYTIYQQTADWRVEADLGHSCSATLKPIGSANVMSGATKTRSNIQNNRLLGFKDNTFANSIKLYPNPATSQLNLEIKGKQEEYKNIELSITNMLGSVVYMSTMDAQVKTIDVSAFSKGIYTLNVKGAKGNTAFKVVVN
ncbi:MAG: hypothetical protein JWO32_1900 [Bacteroidetes bacterium]|nr:hypothetical protein [Bacteroidota bacterium]